MKNLILAALIAAQAMDWWHVFCENQEEIVWSLFIFFYMALLFIRLADRYVAKMKRIRRMDEMLTRAYRGQR